MINETNNTMTQFETITQNDVQLRKEHNAEGLKSATLISKYRKVDIYKYSDNNWFVGICKIDRDNESGINPQPRSLRTYTNMSNVDAIEYFEKKQKQLGF